MLQDLVGDVIPAFRATESWTNNLIGSALACAAWGYFLYQGVIDPFGGIWTLWPLFGASNQMLAAIALILCTVIFFKMKRERFAWVTLVPTAWLVICTVTAGIEKVASPDPKVGFVAHARLFGDAIASGKVLAPAKTLDQMSRIVVQRHRRRDPGGDLRRHCARHARLRRPGGAPRAAQREGDDPRDGRRGGGGGMSANLAARARFVCDRVAETARLMVGVPDYPTYVAHREANHPGRAGDVL